MENILPYVREFHYSPYMSTPTYSSAIIIRKKIERKIKTIFSVSSFSDTDRIEKPSISHENDFDQKPQTIWNFDTVVPRNEESHVSLQPY